MAAPAFGFSVGDFVTVVQLICKVSSALKSVGGAADDYKLLRQELEELQCVLEQLKDLPSWSSPSLNHYNAIRGMALRIQEPLEAFLGKMERYKAALGTSTDKAVWQGVKRKVQWAVGMEEEVRRLRSIVTMKIATISLLLALPFGYAERSYIATSD